MKIEESVVSAVKRSKSDIILRSEVAEMGSASQISKALKSLQVKGILVRIGMGVYARTRKSSVTGAIIPAGSLETLATETLKKMGISVSAGRAAREYNSGMTTQLPGSFVANTGKRRISRKLTVGGRSLVYENNYGVTEFK
jgi:predicted transcriptional regulator of viral defense system